MTAQTVRITIQPIENGEPKAVPQDGALVKEDFGRPAARFRALDGARIVKCGDLSVRVSADPFMVRISGTGGRVIQQLQPDSATGKILFPIGDAPILGLGQGGPQFDKRGIVDRMGSGQGAFRLATHGGKVPVQFVIGTSGWAMFIHQPAGAFDFTGSVGLFVPANFENSLPLETRFVSPTREFIPIATSIPDAAGRCAIPPHLDQNNAHPFREPGRNWIS